MSIHIAVLMMVKNEKKRLHVSLESIKDIADSLVLFDTGSTDNTIEIAESFCKSHNIPFRLKRGEFKTFCISRNESLAFAETFRDIDYLLLLDTNDELRDPENKLRSFCEQYMSHNDKTGFLMAQEWWSGQHDRYYNVRLFKANQGWRYRGSVHEWVKNELLPEGVEPNVIRVPESVVLYQDRTQDDDKTGKRFHRDYELLMSDHIQDPTEPRTVFYLAQTLACLDRKEESLYFYRLRTTLGGFYEEVFHAYLRAARLMAQFNQPWGNVIDYLLKAYTHTNRAEPLIYIADHYRYQNQWSLAYAFISICCELQYPSDCILFVDKAAYDWKRWHLMGIIGYYSGKYEEGKKGCLKALEARPDSQIDKTNLKFYLDWDLQKPTQPA